MTDIIWILVILFVLFISYFTIQALYYQKNNQGKVKNNKKDKKLKLEMAKEEKALKL